MSENEINKEQKILDVKNLSVRFETEEGIVRAVRSARKIPPKNVLKPFVILSNTAFDLYGCMPLNVL